MSVGPSFFATCCASRAEKNHKLSREMNFKCKVRHIVTQLERISSDHLLVLQLPSSSRLNCTKAELLKALQFAVIQGQQDHVFEVTVSSDHENQKSLTGRFTYHVSGFYSDIERLLPEYPASSKVVLERSTQIRASRDNVVWLFGFFNQDTTLDTTIEFAPEKLDPRELKRQKTEKCQLGIFLTVKLTSCFEGIDKYVSGEVMKKLKEFNITEIPKCMHLVPQAKLLFYFKNYEAWIVEDAIVAALRSIMHVHSVNLQYSTPDEDPKDGA